MAINYEQEKVINKLEEVIKFFRGTQIKNEDSLFIINEHLDTLMSSLKYLPVEPPFDSLPPEIKTDILGYLCNSGAFIAVSVCQEWKEILQKRLQQLDEVNIGKHCVKCEDNECFMPQQVLKASITLNLDVPLSVCHPLPDVHTELIVKGLTSVSNLTIEDNCENCIYNDDDGYPVTVTLQTEEFKELFEELEKEQKIMNNLQLTNLDLHGLNQDMLTNYLLNNVKNLTLDECNDGEMLDNKLFIRTLLQNSPDSKLESLTLPSFEHSEVMSIHFADAVCKVKNVNLGILPSLQEGKIAMRLVENIQAQNIRMKTLKLSELLNWGLLISPDELKAILNKMDGLHLVGYFTPDQVDAAKSLPGIEAGSSMISKKSI